MVVVNAMGDACPIPVVKTKKMIAAMPEGGEVKVLVDNEIAVQNLTKMANQMKYPVKSEKLGDAEFIVMMEVTPASETPAAEEAPVCTVDKRGNTVVAIGSSTMGTGNDELGATLLKGFIYALSEQDELPKTMLFYNGGAKITTEGSSSIEDLKSLAAQGVEILTCGTCLNFYGLADKLQVGEVTNMYVIAKKMADADKIIKP